MGWGGVGEAGRRRRRGRGDGRGERRKGGESLRVNMPDSAKQADFPFVGLLECHNDNVFAEKDTSPKKEFEEKKSTHPRCKYTSSA